MNLMTQHQSVEPHKSAMIGDHDGSPRWRQMAYPLGLHPQIPGDDFEQEMTRPPTPEPPKSIDEPKVETAKETQPHTSEHTV